MVDTKTATDKTRRGQDARRTDESARRSKRIQHPIPDTTTKSYWDTISRWPARFED